MELALLAFLAGCWALLGTGAITSLVAMASRGSRSRNLDEAWRQYAWSKKFRFLPASGEHPHARSPRVEGHVGDVELVIEACSLTVRGVPRACTRVWGHADSPLPARVIASSDPRLVQGPGAHQLEPLALGDPFFDQAFQVRASHGDAACRLLPAELRRALQGLLSSSYKLALVLQVDEGEVSLTWLGEETCPSTLDEACSVVARACAAHAGYR